ncbi:unnamed protein product [Lathyrus sativus]|nr:unnamed protein product [Lathyrus sativus]
MTNVGTIYATSENTISTPPLTVSSEMPPPHTKKRKNHSEAWNHFIVSSKKEQKASCKYYDTKIKYSNITLGIISLYRRKKNKKLRANIMTQKLSIVTELVPCMLIYRDASFTRGKGHRLL